MAATRKPSDKAEEPQAQDTSPEVEDTSPEVEDTSPEVEDAATAQPTEDYTHAGGYMLTERGWVLADNPVVPHEYEEAKD